MVSKQMEEKLDFNAAIMIPSYLIMIKLFASYEAKQ